ncbi:hypothetical protein VNO77_02679 [Canavalia gladiata]|uniref:Sulfotransferase n=1 Tax=Canavalia gladiata TaxID=3824 RepID=A0AAN9MTD3_CANGL
MNSHKNVRRHYPHYQWKEVGFATYLCQYQGFWHTSRQLQGVLSCQKHFEAHDIDILSVTTPKSGTTWLKAWTFALLNGVSLCGPFWAHVLEEPEKIMFIRFEEMKMKPNFILKELARFLGCPFSKEEEDASFVNDILEAVQCE